MASFDDDYDIRTFTPVLVNGTPDAATRDWIAATRIAFHQDGGDESIAQDARGAAADGRVLTGVYATHPLPGALGADWPVGTYAGYTKTINVGGGALLDAYLISDVTVRPTHKRKGMLRRLMTERLRAAADSGLAIAALTASESGIYRRFGFGPATRLRSVVIRHEKRFALHLTPTGHTELAEAHSLSDIAREVFAGFHATTPGSIDRQHQLWQRRIGLQGDSGKPDDTMRAAIHYAEGSDAIDGYVTYRMKEVGDDDVLEVVDLVASSPNAYLGLWAFIGSVDLVDRITSRSAPVVDPLLQAMVESRTLETDGEWDHVWLRILDPIAALSARPYAADGQLTLRVHDSLGFCEGVYELTAARGAGTLRQVDASTGAAVADLELDAATLASLYLGGTSAQVLAEAGLVTARTPEALALATGLFAPDRPVYGITYF
ncbi:hypothetical protein AX769_02520 [Frondihabitans sp. PAMC 28766]|uniref:GNAT family N-acetyltransferase n=1 Tax=Frondihabitans sp. PAMC 28766 TaxID=1795630 RepID=UPI00078BBA6D|nr:GNAT family N-acetyltransferase [Frondihabitans sp. PAMC 28766]AMM19212.1 hypothetical protein AX769_02520 [Frondihabitans sp. PAMC 28766]